jgi:hypothetical protein
MLKVCQQLNIPAHEVDFSREYWIDIFEPFIATYESGEATPNPDVMCNRYVKFGAFRKYCKERLGVVKIATGHYARLFSTPASPCASEPTPRDLSTASLYSSQFASSSSSSNSSSSSGSNDNNNSSSNSTTTVAAE